jgi:hypothetical protein
LIKVIQLSDLSGHLRASAQGNIEG